MSEGDQRGPSSGWWPGSAIGLDGNFLAGAFAASVAIALLGRWLLGVGLGETVGGWAVLMMLMCSSRAFQFSIHQSAENARATVAETTGRAVGNTNPLPRAFHEPRPDDDAPAIVPDPIGPGAKQSVPSVERGS